MGVGMQILIVDDEVTTEIFFRYDMGDATLPRGKFISPVGNQTDPVAWIAVDNSTGNCWEEMFPTQKGAASWLSMR